jgi:hypothetical protein
MRPVAFLALGSLLAAQAFLVCNVGAAAPTPAHSFAANPCRTPDAATATHLHYLRLWSAAPTKAAWRAGTKVPLISDTVTMVTVVSDSTLCASALAAYNATATPDSAVTEIELFRADTVFVAGHPRVMNGEWNIAYVFGSAFQFLSSYLQ